MAGIANYNFEIIDLMYFVQKKIMKNLLMAILLSQLINH